jgi:hypothetical protein
MFVCLWNIVEFILLLVYSFAISVCCDRIMKRFMSASRNVSYPEPFGGFRFYFLMEVLYWKFNFNPNIFYFILSFIRRSNQAVPDTCIWKCALRSVHSVRKWVRGNMIYAVIYFSFIVSVFIFFICFKLTWGQWRSWSKRKRIKLRGFLLVVRLYSVTLLSRRYIFCLRKYKMSYWNQFMLQRDWELTIISVRKITAWLGTGNLLSVLFTSVISKVDCTVLGAAKGRGVKGGRWRWASPSTCFLFAIEVISRSDIRKLVSLRQAHPSLRVKYLLNVVSN